MTRFFLDNNEYVTLAVKFDRAAPALLETATRLCRRLGKKLCLLHVLEPWVELPLAGVFGQGGDPLGRVSQAMEASTRDLALGRLAELAQTVSPEISVRTVVVAGKPIERIGSEAENVGTCLLIVGASYNGARLLPQGLSLALSLMAGAPVPVLALDAMRTPRPEMNKLILMLADDLGAQTETAVEFAYALATALGNTTLYHVHVNSLSYASLETGLAAAAASGHTRDDEVPGVADELYQALTRRLGEALEERGADQRDYLEAAGGTCITEVLTGDVAQQLGDLIQTTNPALLIFGRHRALQMRPFFIGRLPYRTMLAFKCPVVVVPGE